MHAAADAGRCALLALLASKGADPDVADERGQTPLHRAVLAGREATVIVLLELGADPNAFDSAGATALHHAALRGDERCTARLLESGADAFARDLKGRDARRIAEGGGSPAHARVAQLLTALEADGGGGGGGGGEESAVGDGWDCLSPPERAELAAQTAAAREAMFPGSVAAQHGPGGGARGGAESEPSQGSGGEDGGAGAGEFDALDEWTGAAGAQGSAVKEDWEDMAGRDAKFAALERAIRAEALDEALDEAGGASAGAGAGAGAGEPQGALWHRTFLAAQKRFPYRPPPPPAGLPLSRGDGAGVGVSGPEANDMQRAAAAVDDQLREIVRAFPRRAVFQAPRPPGRGIRESMRFH
jgi:hypothetical protein